jgi:hypothetical protein
MANFRNFEEQVIAIRVAIVEETEELFKENPEQQNLECGGEGLSISMADGYQDVERIIYDPSSTVWVKTENGVHDLMDLETDDMVAIYENVWYQLKEK